jgi:hypothetical protein
VVGSGEEEEVGRKKLKEALEERRRRGRRK